MSITNVVLVGANGRLGPSILQALLDVPEFKVSVLVRASSKSTYPSSVNVLRTDDNLSPDQLVRAFQGHDAVVISFAGTQKDTSIRIADAAFETSTVKHIIPADFGSCDSSDPRSLDLVPLYVNKKDVRDHLVKLSKQKRPDGTSLSWTSLITGHFFDYGLKSGLLSMDVKKHTARVFDDGKHKFAATKLATIGLATSRALQHADHPRIKNKLVYVHSISTTQNELIAVVEDVVGHKFEIDRVDSEQFITKYKGLLEQSSDSQRHDFIEELVSVEGIVNAEWENRKGDAFVNDLLLSGLSENLQDLVKDALK
ncbi:hypothetical protein H2198_002712 [Neophaeococcomyces mojaviensis]|uniref:Uncharacterized protein n=1 Tax=Neophaeococcomyces mojaviensis TaxID=3383035 RepID=A0ACC3AEC3_9EURO|nr:hypothetical protein H2198_002712 [Knufia sp. JES_112]